MGVSKITKAGIGILFLLATACQAESPEVSVDPEPGLTDAEYGAFWLLTASPETAEYVCSVYAAQEVQGVVIPVLVPYPDQHEPTYPANRDPNEVAKGHKLECERL